MQEKQKVNINFMLNFIFYIERIDYRIYID